MRKGQATNASYLISMIALFVIIYIILLPEGEKERVITDTNQVGDEFFDYYEDYSDYDPTAPFYDSTRSAGAKTLVSESPGVIYPHLRSVFSKPLASINLFSESNKNTEELASSIVVSSGVFSETKKVLSFSLDDVEKVEDASLNFLTVASKGNLIVELNNQEIFNEVVETSDLPIKLPKRLLKENNKLEISTDAGYLAQGYYELKNVQLIKNLETSNNFETRVFVLSDSEYKNLEYLTLYYFANCFTIKENTRLIIRSNGKIVSDSLIVCDAAEVGLDLDKSDLLAGRNVLEFQIDKGKHTLEKVLIEGEIIQKDFPSYNFFLGRSEIDSLRSGARVNMQMRFFDDSYRKALNAHINGNPIYVDTKSGIFYADITDFINEGQNVVRLVPAFDLEVVDLEIFLD